MTDEREQYKEPHCQHCRSDYNLRNVPCAYTAGDSPHCSRHREHCAICEHYFCWWSLIENDVGELLCNDCDTIMREPLFQAAKRASQTGSHKDLKEYVRLRRAAN